MTSIDLSNRKTQIVNYQDVWYIPIIFQERMNNQTISPQAQHTSSGNTVLHFALIYGDKFSHAYSQWQKIILQIQIYHSTISKSHPSGGRRVAAPSACGGVWPGQAMMCSRILSILSMAEASVSRMSLGSQQFTRPVEVVDEGIRLFPSNRDITTNFPFACASWCRCQSPDRSAAKPRATVCTHIKPWY